MNSTEILDIVNELTSIHNNIVENNMFCAGSNLAWLQHRLVEKMKIKEKEENAVKFNN